MQRFLSNCRRLVDDRRYGPLVTAEIEVQRTWWIKKAQQDTASIDEIEKDKVNLNLQPNSEEVLECRGRILLDLQVTAISEARQVRLLGMQTVPSPVVQKPTTRKSTFNPNRRFHPLRISWSGLRWTDPLQGKKTKKAYLVMYGCSLTRAVYLEMLKSLETAEFLASLKWFIARWGRPKVVYSDNGTTFKAAESWLKKVQNELNDFFSKQQTYQLTLPQ